MHFDFPDTATASTHPIELGISPELDRAVQRLVRDKCILDRAAAEEGAHMLARDLHDGGYGPHEPLCFLSLVLPFFFLTTHHAGLQLALVPTANTLGCSWKRRSPPEDKEQARQLVDKLTSAADLAAGTLDKALYLWIKELGLFAPLEGKNRVDFLREHGQPCIPAMVRSISYPAAARLKVYQVEASAFAETWAVLDGRWVEKIDNPSWTLPVLGGYGVQISTQWPADFPSPELVVQSRFGYRGTTTPLGHAAYPKRPVVDLQTLQATADYLDAPVRCTVAQVGTAKVDSRVWYFCAALALLSCFAISLAPASWVDLRLVAAIGFGTAIGALLMLAATPVMITHRRNLRGQIQQLPLEHAPKHRPLRTRHVAGEKEDGAR